MELRRKILRIIERSKRNVYLARKAIISECERSSATTTKGPYHSRRRFIRSSDTCHNFELGSPKRRPGHQRRTSGASAAPTMTELDQLRCSRCAISDIATAAAARNQHRLVTHEYFPFVCLENSDEHYPPRRLARIRHLWNSMHKLGV